MTPSRPSAGPAPRHPAGPTAYAYAAVQCRDPRAYEEVRTLGAVLVAPEARFGGLAVMPIDRKLAPGTVLVVREVLRAWTTEVEALGASPLPKALAWLHARAVGAEDLVRLSPPAFGLTDDPRDELRRLRTALTGYRPAGGQTPTEKALVAVLRAHGLSARFQPATLAAGPAGWRFPRVHGHQVLHTVEFAQQQASGVVDAAWRDVGRFRELRRAMHALDALVVTPRPGTAAVERAHDVYRESDLHVVYAERSHIEAGLARWGLLAGPADAR
jgi:hypothetical protein